MPSQTELQNELQRLRESGFDVKLTEQAQANGLSPTFLFAIASRETQCANILGDFQNGEAHGVGILQIDIQHAVARQARDDGSWKTNPDPLIAFGAQLLADNIRQVSAALPGLSGEDQLKVAASGYNTFIGTAIKDARNGDSDVHTTGHNYGADVMARMAVFDQLTAQAAAAGV